MSLPVDEALARVLVAWPEEMRVLRRFGLRDGMRVLDLGSGPGLVTAELLRRSSGTTAVGIDSNPEVWPRARAATKPVADRVRFLQGSVVHLPFRDASFDCAMARLVFQYLSEPVFAAREGIRVIRPGGHLAITDVDRALSYTMHPLLKELDTLMDRFDALQHHRGCDRGVGGRLGEILREAGARSVVVETLRFRSRPENVARFLDSLMGTHRLETLRRQGYASQAEVDDYVRARAAWLATPCCTVTRYLRMACGTHRA